MGKVKTKLEKIAPEAVMADQQLFVTDRAGHESHMIKKMREKAGRVQGPKVPEVDRSLDDVVSRKDAAKYKRIEQDVIKAMQPEDYEFVSNWGNTRAKQAAVTAATHKRKRPSAIVRTDPVRDVWTEKVAVLNPLLDNGQTMYETSKIPRVRQHDRRPNAAHLLQSIELPTTGMSFNPTKEAHAKALAEAAEIVVQQNEARRRLNSVVSAPLNRLSRVPVVQLLAAPLPLDDEEVEEQSDAKRMKISVSNERQTTKEKNKQDRKDQTEKILQQKAAKKALSAQIDQVDQIAAELAREQAEREQQRAEIKSKKQTHNNHLPRLGPVMFQPAVPVVALPEDLKGSLFAVKPIAAPVAAQFNNLQRRNLIETRNKNNYKRRYEKRVLKPKNIPEK